MKVAQISKPGGPFEIVEREIPQPSPGTVRIKVEACGICHSDVLVKEGHWPGLQYPRVPGHEVGGRVDALGPNVTNWKVGQRVGVGWHGGHDFVCDSCRRGDFVLCANLVWKAIGLDVAQEGLDLSPRSDNRYYVKSWTRGPPPQLSPRLHSTLPKYLSSQLSTS